MNHYVDTFLKDVLEKVKYKKIHPYLAQELNDHIGCLKEDLMESGLDEEQAYKEAVSHMGEAEGIGENLHKMHKPRMGWSILLLLIGLIGIGLWTMLTYSQVGGQSFYLRKQIMWVIVGIGIFLVTMYCSDYKRWENYTSLFYGY